MAAENPKKSLKTAGSEALLHKKLQWITIIRTHYIMRIAISITLKWGHYIIACTILPKF